MIKIYNYKNILYISLLLHILAAIFSSGFQHFDEHFQIYEFLNYKLGNIPGSNLPWEFREKIRPWFQVFTYFLTYKTLNVFGVSSPFLMATFFRLLTSLFGLYALTRLFPIIKIWFKDEKDQILAFLLLNLTWFVPYIQVRTNSESFGISFFILGLAAFIKEIENPKKVFWGGFIAGLFFGLSYLSRSQMAFNVAFLWFWALFIKRPSHRLLLSSALSIILVILSGVLFDYWGYGQWTFSTWHYFRTNFLEGIMSSVQQYPWWWYFRLALLRGIPPLSLPLILASVWAWVRYRKHPLTWATLPLFLFHCYVGHKELRYIFPIIILSPLFLAFYIRDYRDKFEHFLQKTWFKVLLNFIIGLNTIFLLIGTFRAANPAVNFYKYVWNNENIRSLHIVGENPYTMLGLPLEFYKKKDLKLSLISDHKSFLQNLSKEKYIFFNKGHYIDKMANYPQCERVYLTYPSFILKFNIGNWVSRSRVWSIYKCTSAH